MTDQTYTAYKIPHLHEAVMFESMSSAEFGLSIVIVIVTAIFITWRLIRGYKGPTKKKYSKAVKAWNKQEINDE